MGGLMKLAAGTVTGLFLVLAVTMMFKGKHDAQMAVDDAAFDKEWSQQMGDKFSKTKAEKQRNYAQAAAAQTRLSSARAELSGHTKKVDKMNSDLDKTLDDQDGKKGGK